MPTHSYLPIEKQHVNMENMKQKWYRPNIDPKVLKNLSKRRDAPGYFNTVAYFLLLFVTGYLAYLSWETWWAV